MEIEIVKTIQKLNSAFFDIFCEFISYISNYFGFLFLFLIFFIFLNKKYALCLGFTYGIGIGFNYLFKALFNRLRPYEVDLTIINKLSATGSSFPSGHTVGAMIISIFIIYYIFKNSRKKYVKIISIILLIIFIISVGFSRMYLGQHYLTDIIGGMIFGLIYSFLGILCYNKIEKDFKGVKDENKGNSPKKNK